MSNCFIKGKKQQQQQQQIDRMTLYDRASLTCNALYIFSDILKSQIIYHQ